MLFFDLVIVWDWVVDAVVENPAVSDALPVASSTFGCGNAHASLK